MCVAVGCGAKCFTLVSRESTRTPMFWGSSIPRTGPKIAGVLSAESGTTCSGRAEWSRNKSRCRVKELSDLGGAGSLNFKRLGRVLPNHFSGPWALSRKVLRKGRKLQVAT